MATCKTLTSRRWPDFGGEAKRIDLANAPIRGGIAHTPVELTERAADLTIRLILLAAQRTADTNRALRPGNRAARGPADLTGTRVAGKTLGIIGYGRVGQAVAQRARREFGMAVVVHNRRRVDHAALAFANATQANDLADLLPQCDFVSLHCTGEAANHHMINALHLNLMKPDAFLINTAQGDLINEIALFHALAFETIGGAALGLRDRQRAITPDLISCDRLILPPHRECQPHGGFGFRATGNSTASFDRQTPPDRVN
ncbi:MAG: NAD(P)-dependent oxidoreductase [Albidovulum sp.]